MLEGIKKRMERGGEELSKGGVLGFEGIGLGGGSCSCWGVSDTRRCRVHEVCANTGALCVMRTQCASRRRSQHPRFASISMPGMSRR